jgi:hypothetical protein
MPTAKLVEVIATILVTLLSKLDVNALFHIKGKCNEHLLAKISKEKPETPA